MTEEPYLGTYRRRITGEQLEVLVQYMERYPDIALSAARSRDGHMQSRQMWEKIARTLNRIENSQARSGYGWARYWADWKFKVRRKYLTIQKCQNDKSSCTILLSPLEQRLVKILTDEEGNLLRIGSVYSQMIQYPSKADLNSSQNIMKLEDNSKTKPEDIEVLEDVTTEDIYFKTDSIEILPEHILVPDSCDSKSSVDAVDPIEIAENQKTIEELKRELVEFELKRQKELFEIDKKQKIEKHELEMAILRVKKQMMLKELKKI